ncbi:transporter [Zobellella iuensis]|uniref:Transporter n=1 Tax=Zobellella iuensis TaxID=2803811 RepID=A0ABS1QRG8_9GAMM|nr:transporter [Zobellella iuensis]MBL1377464.1 transporter [Zobellella iuensis]
MKKRIIFASLLLSAASTAHAQDRQVVEAIASSLDSKGLLTPQGRFELEPSFSYGQNTSTRVSILGYSVLPAIIVGLIDVQDQDLATFTVGLAGRYGLTDRIELELRAPWVYRYDSYRFRKTEPTVDTRTVTSTGGALGDIEGAIRYQFNMNTSPYWIGGLRVKSDTGRSPFEEEMDADNIFRRPPTGTGAWSVEPSLTLIYPTDPAVIFGTAGYTHNFKTRVRSQGSTPPPDAPDPDMTLRQNDEVRLGDSFFMGMGMGFAVNNRLSFSLGLNHRTVLTSKVNGKKAPGSKMLQLDSLSMGFSLALTERTTLNMNAQAGLTEDAPDVQVNFSMPIMF